MAVYRCEECDGAPDAQGTCPRHRFAQLVPVPEDELQDERELQARRRPARVRSGLTAATFAFLGIGGLVVAASRGGALDVIAFLTPWLMVVPPVALLRAARAEWSQQDAKQPLAWAALLAAMPGYVLLLLNELSVAFLRSNESLYVLSIDVLQWSLYGLLGVVAALWVAAPVAFLVASSAGKKRRLAGAAADPVAAPTAGSQNTPVTDQQTARRARPTQATTR